MEYSVNGKIYTDHPLMDEIVYNCKIILKGIVIKNDVLADDFEEEEYIQDVETYMMINRGDPSFNAFPFTTEILKAFGYSDNECKDILVNKENVPESDRKSLLEFASGYFLDHYEEKNNYYRRLMGLPEYGTNEYDIYIDSSYLPSSYNKEVDFSKPIHKLDLSVIDILQTTGVIDDLLDKYKGSNYSYLRFLGNQAIDLYKARSASKYDILYIPHAESLVKDRFIELYDVNRNIYLKRTYSEAYYFNSEYYEEMMILMILAQTFNDMIVDVPEWYIRRDIFDIRSVQYFLESFGVKFFKVIPLKYQIRIVKNLNKLIKYKSSNKNFADILEIFASKNTSIYKYYLFKKRLVDSKGNYKSGETDSDKYELEFVQSKINESYDDYIKDMIYRTPYDDITYPDKYWDGEDEHSYIKEYHMNRDFTIEGTKYMSIEYKIDQSEYLFQMEYFNGLIMDSNLYQNDVTIAIPSIQNNTLFRLSDLFLFLMLLTLGYDSLSTLIRRPGDVEELLYSKYYDIHGGYSNTKKDEYKKDYDGKNASHPNKFTYADADGKYADDSKEPADYIYTRKTEKPEFTKYDDYNGGYSYTHEDEYGDLYSINGGTGHMENGYLAADGGNHVEYSEIRSVEHFYDWMKKYFEEFFVNKENRVFGFNSNIDLSELEEIISRRHTEYQFDNGFTLEDLGVDKFIVPKKIDSIEDLMNIYFTNKECYDNLKNLIIEKADDRDELKVLEYVFNELFTKEFDYPFYQVNGKDAKYLEEILEDRDFILYSEYRRLMSETNEEARKDNLRNIMNDVVNTLEYYLSADGLDYIFAFATISSFNAILNYIYLMIDFFKSYKVYFLDPFVTFVSNDKLENNFTGHDSIAEKKIDYWKPDKEFHRDNIGVHPYHEFEERPREESTMEVLDVYGHFDPDPNDDYDYDGMNADAESEGFKDADGGLANDSSCIPYIMLNGGSSYEDRLDIWDLDGANATEMINVLDVDGGYTEHYDDRRKDYWSSAFKYIIDGASAGNEFISKSLHIKVIDKQIESIVKISNKEYNRIILKEDGLYLEQLWAAQSEFDEFMNDFETTYAYFSNRYTLLSDILDIASNPEILNSKIENAIDNQLNNMRIFNTNMEEDKFEEELKEYIDDSVQSLYTAFGNYSPFAFEDF